MMTYRAGQARLFRLKIVRVDFPHAAEFLFQGRTRFDFAAEFLQQRRESLSNLFR